MAAHEIVADVEEDNTVPRRERSTDAEGEETTAPVRKRKAVKKTRRWGRRGRRGGRRCRRGRIRRWCQGVCGVQSVCRAVR